MGPRLNRLVDNRGCGSHFNLHRRINAALARQHPPLIWYGALIDLAGQRPAERFAALSTWAPVKSLETIPIALSQPNEPPQSFENFGGVQGPTVCFNLAPASAIHLELAGVVDRNRGVVAVIFNQARDTQRFPHVGVSEVCGEITGILLPDYRLERRWGFQV